METLKNRQILVETLKKQKNIRGDVKETGKCSWRRESNRQIFEETLKKQTNIRGDAKGTDKYSWRR